LQSYKVKPHSHALLQEEIINQQRVIRGSVIYPLNFGNDPYNRGEGVIYYQYDNGEMEAFDLPRSLNIIRESSSKSNNPHDSFFGDLSNEIFLYKNGQYFYNFPVVYTINTQILKSHYTNL